MYRYLSLHPWYQNFTEWIEWLPEEKHDFGEVKLDKSRDMRGLPNDVHNGTRRPLTAEKFCSVLKYFLKTTDILDDGLMRVNKKRKSRTVV